MRQGTGVVERASVFDVPRSTVLRDEVVISIEKAVLLGAVAPGERLVEADIARQMGISKAPVREALRRLEQLGLVVSRPRRGTFVAELTPRVASEAFSLRAVLEAYAGRLAVRRLEDADLARMEELLAEADDAPWYGNHLIRKAELDLAFHDQIFRLSGHGLLEEAWASLRAKIRLLLVATGVLRVPSPSNGRSKAYSQDHAPIVEALRARDPDRADAAIRRHLADGERLLLEKLEAVHPASTVPGSTVVA